MNDTKTPFSYKLIYNFKEKQFISNGLTIPFIIGANAILNELYSITDNCIETMLSDIINSSTKEIAVLQKCRDINQFVIGYKERTFTEKYFKIETFFENSNGVKSLYLTQDANKLGATIPEITHSLNTLFLPTIKEEKFSWDGFNETWRYFTLNDEKNIQNL